MVLIKLFTLPTLAGETGWAFGFSSQIGSGNDDEYLKLATKLHYGNLWHPMTFASMTSSFWFAGTGEIEDVRLYPAEIYIVSRL